MTIRNKRVPGDDGPEAKRFRRKADQAWDLAGCARRDGDMDASKKYTEEARQYEALWREALNA